MKVTLLDYTGKHAPVPADYAAGLMIFTKNTRLQMSPGQFEATMAMPYPEKLRELEYMANTIPSSWEFVDYTFMIEGVTRAFTHQLVRTRTASFAQQTMRILDVSEGPGWDYLAGPSFEDKFDARELYEAQMEDIADNYKELIKMGVSIEDARGILPTNILTNIVMKINMRNFVELVRKRSSSRVQGEYRDVLLAMQQQALLVHPWLVMFIDRTFDRAANELDAEIRASDLPQEGKTKLIKLIDQMRAQS